MGSKISTHNFGVRQYDEILGRFMSIDPLWYEQLNWSPYHYCGNDPVNGRDPDGLQVLPLPAPTPLFPIFTPPTPSLDNLKSLIRITTISAIQPIANTLINVGKGLNILGNITSYEIPNVRLRTTTFPADATGVGKPLIIYNEGKDSIRN